MLLLAACQAEVLREVPEPAANEVVAELTRVGVPSRKRPLSSPQGHYGITVPEAYLGRALLTLEQAGLPRASAPAPAEEPSIFRLVPSRSEEAMRRNRQLAQQLEVALERVDGVVSAAVQVAVAEAQSPGCDAPAARAAALLRYRPPTMPLTVSEVQHWVSSAVPGLTPPAVEVVFKPAAEPQALDPLVAFGPVQTTPASLPILRLALLLTAVVLSGLASSLLYAWRQLGRKTEPTPAGSRVSP